MKVPGSKIVPCQGVLGSNHSLTFGLFTQVRGSGPLGPLVYFYLSKKIRLDFSCESSAYQRIDLKHQVLFSMKNHEKIFMNVVCCSRDWVKT